MSARDTWLIQYATRDAFDRGSTELRPGFAEAVIQELAKRGLKLSEREVRRRLRMFMRQVRENLDRLDDEAGGVS